MDLMNPRWISNTEGQYRQLDPIAMKPKAVTEVVLRSLPSILKALNDNPLGAVVLVVLAAFALVGYAVRKCT